jgi:ribosomal protein L2
MAIRKYKPTTPGRRGSSVADFVESHPDHAGEVR